LLLNHSYAPPDGGAAPGGEPDGAAVDLLWTCFYLDRDAFLVTFGPRCLSIAAPVRLKLALAKGLGRVLPREAEDAATVWASAPALSMRALLLQQMDRVALDCSADAAAAAAGDAAARPPRVTRDDADLATAVLGMLKGAPWFLLGRSGDGLTSNNNNNTSAGATATTDNNNGTASSYYGSFSDHVASTFGSMCRLVLSPDQPLAEAARTTLVLLHSLDSQGLWELKSSGGAGRNGASGDASAGWFSRHNSVLHAIGTELLGAVAVSGPRLLRALEALRAIAALGNEYLTSRQVGTSHLTAPGCTTIVLLYH
jgi:hypothetical protein